MPTMKMFANNWFATSIAASGGRILGTAVSGTMSGELPTDVNLDDYARYLSTLLRGLAILAANGIPRAEMKRIADMAVRHLGY